MDINTICWISLILGIAGIILGIIGEPVLGVISPSKREIKLLNRNRKSPLITLSNVLLALAIIFPIIAVCIQEFKTFNPPPCLWNTF